MFLQDHRWTKAFLKEAPHLPVTPSTVPSDHLAFGVCKQALPDRLLGVSPLGKHVTNTNTALKAGATASRWEQTPMLLEWGKAIPFTQESEHWVSTRTFLPPPPNSRAAHTQVHSALAYLPREDHHEVHDIPAVPKVGALVENEAQGYDLDARLEAKDPNEVRLRVILRENTGHCSPLSSKKAAWQQFLSDDHTYYPKAGHPGDFPSMQCSH